MNTSPTRVRRKPIPVASSPPPPPPPDNRPDMQGNRHESDNRAVQSPGEIVVVPATKARTTSTILEEPPHQPKPKISRSKTSAAWDPIALHWLTLVTFSIVFILMLAAVIVLFEISRSNEGLAHSKPSYHYAWTYGPMALLVVVAGAWYQVDYQCRMLAPWKSLASGPRPAVTTLLLDYISPMPPVACFQAVRNRDWAVAASSAAGMLLDLALVFSTALLVLIPVRISQDDNHIPLTTSFSNQNMVNYSGDSAAVMSYWATLDRGLGLPYGSTHSNAFSQVNLSIEGLQNGSLVAHVPTFVPNLRCERADLNFTIGHRSTWKYDSPELDAELIFDLSQSTPSCQTMTLNYGGPNMLQDVVPPRILTGIVGDADVCEDLNAGYVPPWTWTVLDMRYTQIFGPSQDDTLNVTMWHAELANATGIMCYPSYAIRSAIITTDTNTEKLISLVVEDESPTEKIDNFNDTLFSITLSLALDRLFQTLPPRWQPLDLTQQASDSAGFTLMSMLQPDTTIEKFLDAHELINAAETVFNGIAAQFAHIELSTPSTSFVHGSREFSELRIVVKEMPMIVLSVCFGLLAILSIVILMVRPRGVVPLSPRSLMANASLMQESPAVRQRLSSCGHLSNSGLKLSLLGSTYRSRLDDDVTIVVEETTLLQDVQASQLTSFGWWRPFASRLYFVIIIITVLCGLIAGLQVVEHFSHPTSGFLYLDTSGADARKWSSIVPTAVMVLTKLAIQSSGGALLLFVPFAMLKRARPSSWRALERSPTGQLPIVNLLREVGYPQISVIVVSLALVLCSFLSIIVSGLYTVADCDHITNKTVSTLDYFDFNWNTTANKSSPDNYAGLNFALLNLHNLSYPAWTFDELVYPRIDQSTLTTGLESSISAGKVKVRIEVPAVRASLDCSFAIPSRATSVWVKDAPGPSNEMVFVQNNQIYVPHACFPSFEPEIINTTTTVPAIILSDGGQYYSIQNEYPWPPYNTSSKDFPGQCPQFGFTFGFAGPHSNSTDNVTSITCYQRIERVQTLTTFVLPEWTIDVMSRPVVDENSIQTVVEYADYFLGDIFSGGLGEETYAPLEPFFINVINGSEGVPEADMLGPQNQERLLSAVQHIYRKYMAQAIHLNMREDVTTPSAQAQTYTASVVDGGRMCLFQNRSPKIVLQAVLGTILLCILAGWVLIPTRQVLPHDPLSIAGTWSLLANGPFGQGMAHRGRVVSLDVSTAFRDARKGKSRPRLGFWSEGGKPVTMENGEEQLSRRYQSNNDSKVWYGIGIVCDEHDVEHGEGNEEDQAPGPDHPFMEHHASGASQDEP
ncbi:hypothetical protein H2204_000120 [Knufia peltigerae]|uniref:Uncharacterized protein n=1 Tax=Knufia peltigerae TaxID=1002370 RepID=A0AA38YFM1_9EURO|nr:hypothetical protein H2204_000120 [Knufia peltigerae]